MKIELYCIKCESRKSVDRHEDDPPKAVRAHIQCPECVVGDFDSTEYFDADGEPFPYRDPDDSVQDQPLTMCNQHGWWGSGPCKLCVDGSPES